MDERLENLRSTQKSKSAYQDYERTFCDEQLASEYIYRYVNSQDSS